MEDKNNDIKLIKRRFAISGNTKLFKKRESVSLFSKRLSIVSNESVSKSPLLNQRKLFIKQNSPINQTEKQNIDDLKKDLYNTANEKDYPKLLVKFFKVKDCSILKYGIKKSVEKIEYSYCKTCDSSSIFPICMACIKNCHAGHNIDKNTKFGNIKCYCGVKLHKISNIKKSSVDNDNNNMKCLCNEWNKIAKLNILYQTNDKKNICEFCNVICFDKSKLENSLDSNDFNSSKLNILNYNMQENCSTNVSECECDCINIHSNKKNILYGNIFFFCKHYSVYEKLLHPSQLINMIFKSQEFFKNTFFDFCEIFKLLKSPVKSKSIFEKYNNVEFTKTRIYLSLNFFRQLVQKLSHKKLFYYCSEVKNFFNFENLKKLYMNSSIYEKPFLLFMKEYLYLFNKIYINRKTKYYYKYNINDLENFSCIQRIILSRNNKKEFPEAEKIIAFFLEWLSNIDNISVYYLETLSCIYQIVCIIYKLTTLNLVTNGNIIRFLLKIVKIFDGISYLRNCIFNETSNNNIQNKNKYNFSIYSNIFGSKINYSIISQIKNINTESKEISSNIEIKICYIIIKIIIYTLYNYNDKVFENFIFDNQNNIHKSLNKKKDFFLFNETELWPIILKMTIIILSFIQNNYYKSKNKREYKTYKTILRHSMTILEHSLCAQDTYFFNLIKSINDIKTNYVNMIEFTESELPSNIINEIIKEKTNISTSYKKFLTFEMSKQDLLSVVNDSLNKILGDDILSLQVKLYNDDFEPCSFSIEKNIGIIKSSYFLEISKILEIIKNNNNNEKCSSKGNGKSFSVDNSQDKNLEKYENISNNDNLSKDCMKGNEYKNIIDKIILFYFCFTNKSSNNSLIILSRYILNELTKLPNDYGYLVFKLIHSCLLNVVSIDYMIINNENIIKISYDFLQKLIFYNDKKATYCIFIFLKILEDLAYKIKNYHSNFIYTIQKYLLLLHNDFQFSFKYYELLEKEKAEEKKQNSCKSFSSSKVSEFSKKKSINDNSDISNINNKDNEIIKDKEESDINEDNEEKKLKNSFSIYIKLINDVFDFSLNKEREKVRNIININLVTYLLKNFNLDLNTRTELLKYSRKMLIDLTFCENNYELYTKAIIDDEDNLVELKSNPLANNSHYPTKYLSFIEDFYNISAKNIIKEKQNLLNMKKSNIMTNESSKNLFPKMSITSKDTSRDDVNLSIGHVSTKQLISNIKENSKNEDFNSVSSKENIKSIKDNKNHSSSSFFKINSCLKNNKTLDAENNMNKSKLSTVPEKISTNEIKKLGTNNKKKIDTSSSLDNNTEFGKVELEIISQNDNENANESEGNTDSYGLKEESLKIEKIQNDSTDKDLINVNSKEESKCNIPFSSVVGSMEQETEGKVNLLSCFDDLFYNILKYELENLTIFVEEESSIEETDSEAFKNILQNYLENGLLISIIYFYKKTFSLIHNYSGKEMIKLHYLVELSINLKLYISKLKYDLWEEEDEVNYQKEIKEIDKNNLNIDISKNNRKSMIKGIYFKNKKLIEQTYKSLDAIKSRKISMFDYISLYPIIEKEFFDILKDKKILYFNKVFDPEKNIEIQKEIKQILDYNQKNQNKNNLDINEKLYNIYLKYQYKKTFLTEEKNSPLFNFLSEINMAAKTDYMSLLLKSLILCWRNEENISEYHCKSFFLLYKLLSIKTSEIQLNIVNYIKNGRGTFIRRISDYLLEKIILLIIEYLNPVNEIKNSHYLSVYTSIKFFKALCQDNNYFFKQYLVKEISYRYVDEMPFYYRTLPGTAEILSSLKNIKLLLNRNFTNSTNSNFSSSEIQSINNSECYTNFFDFFLLFSIKIIVISNWDEFNNRYCTYQNPFLYKLFNANLELLNEIIRSNNQNFVLEDVVIIKEESEKDSEFNDQFKNFKSKVQESTCALRTFFKNVCKILVNNRNNFEILYKIKINILKIILTLIEEKNVNTNIKKEIPKYLNVNQILRVIIHTLKSYYFNNNINSPIKIENKKTNNNDIKKTSSKNTKYNSPKNMANNKQSSPTTTTFPLITSNKNILPIINYRLNKNNENNQQNTFISNSNIKLNYSSNQVYEPNKTYKKNSEDVSKFSEQKELVNEISSSKQLKANTSNKVNNLRLTSLKKIKKEIEWNFFGKTNESNNVLRKKPKILFDKKVCKYFIKEFNNQKEFRETNEFILTNSLYKYFKNIIIFNDNKVMKQFITKVNSTKGNISIKKDSKKNLPNLKKKKSNMIINRIIGFFKNKRETKNDKNKGNNKYYDKEYIEKFYIIKFFESITSSVEVNLADHTTQLIFFTKIPEMIYLSKTTKRDFLHNANRESEANKKKDLMNNIKYFMAEIKYFKEHKRLNNYLKEFNFKIFNIISYIYGVALNIYLFSVVKGDIYTSESNTNESRRKNRSFINNSIDSSLNEWKKVTNILCYLYIALNGILIVLWICFRSPFLYELDKIKYKEIHQFKNKIQLSDKLFIIIFMTISRRDKILILIYEFFLGIVSLFMREGEILFSLFLLPIIELNSTLRLVIKSITLIYKEFLLVLFLSAIIMYTLTNVAYFFFNSDYEEELDYYDDNYCKTLVFCFLNSLDNGLRARGGIGDSGKRISFLRHSNHYTGRIILDDIFFMLIVIILIDMVFGIIVQSFSSLKYKKQLYLKDKYNNCFICNENKKILKKHRINFKNHVKNKHNLWNYVEYIIKIKQSNIQELNSTNQYIRKKIENNDISWLPTNTDLFKKLDDYDNDEIIVLEEKMHEYHEYAIKKMDI